MTRQDIAAHSRAQVIDPVQVIATLAEDARCVACQLLRQRRRTLRRIAVVCQTDLLF